MINTTPVIEKYELKICAVINQITAIEKLIGSQKGIKRFTQKNVDRFIDAMLRLKNAKKELHAAMKCLLDSGNTPPKSRRRGG